MEYSEAVCVALKQNMDIYFEQKGISNFPQSPEENLDRAINIIIMELLV